MSNMLTNLVLTATLLVKDTIDQVVPLLETAKAEDPDYQGVYDCYKTIQENLGNAVDLLEAMK